MPLTLTVLQNDVLSRLNESVNSPAGQLLTGTGGAATIDTLTTITQYLNDAAAQIARSCYPVADSGSYLTPPGTASFSLISLTVSSGNTLWAARGVSWNGTALTRCSRSALEGWYPTWVADTNGTPLYWWDQGEDGVGLYPKPLSAATTIVNGLAIPKVLSISTDVPAWLQPDLVRMMVFHAAAHIALKHTENPQLHGRAEIWLSEYAFMRDALLGRLRMEDPWLAHGWFPADSGKEK